MLCLTMAFPVFAGKVITYTALSQVSQEEANNLAIAGVAKQIVSQVSVNQKLTKQETTANGNSTLSEKFLIQDQVKSLLDIKGITITPVKVEKGYKATATLDLDEFTAGLQFKLRSLQTELKNLQESIVRALEGRQYANAIKGLDRAREIVGSYGKLAEQLGKVYPIDKSFLLEHRISDYETKLQEELSQIRIEGPREALTLNNSEMPPWSITVYDRQGPVENFPLVARQQSRRLLERRTQASGSATFKLRNVNFDQGPYSITIEPNFQSKWIDDAGLRQAFVLSYTVNKTKCNINLQCSEVANICSALEKRLAQKSIFIDEESSRPELVFKMTASQTKALKINGSTTRYAYSIDFTLKGKGVSFMKTVKENGKTPTDATVQALGKLDLEPLLQQLKPLCIP